MPRLPSVALRHLGASLLVLGLAGCATSAHESGVAPPDFGGSDDAAKAPLLPSALFPGDAEHFVGWRCTPDQELVTAHDEEELRLWSAHGAYRLTPSVVASGTRYEQGGLSFWSKGEGAVVESDRGRLECQQNTRHRVLTRETHPGVMFRANGNEPGWNIELAHDTPQIKMMLDYGEREVTLPYRVTSLDNETGRVTLASGQTARPFELRIEARACFDDMSGQPWPARVTLTLNDRVYRGCGQGIAP